MPKNAQTRIGTSPNSSISNSEDLLHVGNDTQKDPCRGTGKRPRRTRELIRPNTGTDRSRLSVKGGSLGPNSKNFRIRSGISLQKQSVCNLETPHRRYAISTHGLCDRTYLWERKKKPINRKHINIFLTALVGQSSQGRLPHPSQGQTGQNGDFTVELNRERPVCPRDGSHFVPGRGPICPRDGLLFVPDTVPPKMFMFIGFFSCPTEGG